MKQLVLKFNFPKKAKEKPLGTSLSQSQPLKILAQIAKSGRTKTVWVLAKKLPVNCWYKKDGNFKFVLLLLIAVVVNELDRDIFDVHQVCACCKKKTALCELGKTPLLN